jgi:restriction system protein
VGRQRATAAKVVETTKFTSEAIEFAKGKAIELVDAAALVQLLRGVQTSGKIVATARPVDPDHLAPASPRCGSDMKLREAKQGANAGNTFWGCSKYPRCHGTRGI